MNPARRAELERVTEWERGAHRPPPRGLGQTEEPVGVGTRAHDNALGLHAPAPGERHSVAVDAHGLTELDVDPGLQEAHGVLGADRGARGLEERLVLGDGERVALAAHPPQAAVALQVDLAVRHVPGEQQPEAIDQRHSRQELPRLPQLQCPRRGVGQHAVRMRRAGRCVTRRSIDESRGRQR